eukprot:2069478-Rhodomonas_salina.2
MVVETWKQPMSTLEGESPRPSLRSQLWRLLLSLCRPKNSAQMQCRAASELYRPQLQLASQTQHAKV